VTHRRLLFVCAHGAARSRIAAAWFNADPPPGWWAATAAAEEAARTLNPRVGSLLAGLPAHGALDTGPPRALAVVDPADLVIAVDCTVPGAQRWTLTAGEVDEALRDELRDRVAALVRALRAGRYRTADGGPG
jgi:arsenate reductase (thioredoxin)